MCDCPWTHGHKQFVFCSCTHADQDHLTRRYRRIFLTIDMEEGFISFILLARSMLPNPTAAASQLTVLMELSCNYLGRFEYYYTFSMLKLEQ